MNRNGKFCNCVPTPKTFTTKGGTFCSVCFGQIPLTAFGRSARYHEHLDECSRCRDNPFGPCEKGNKFLLSVTSGSGRIT